MIKRILLSIILILPLQAAASAPATDTIIVMPFENLSGKPEYNWIGESFAAQLSDLLDKPGLVAIKPDERNVAYKQEGLPPTAILTRATMIKIAERAGASLVIMGSYRINDERQTEKKDEAKPEEQPDKKIEEQTEKKPEEQTEKKSERTITITARIVNIREGRLVSEFNIGGDLLEIQKLQGNLSYEILYKQNQALPFSRDQIVAQATEAPIGAFENFIKGTLTRDREARTAFLERAIKELEEKTKRKYLPAIFELGRAHYEAGDYTEAVKQFSQIDEQYPRYDEAQFYLGVALDAMGQTDRALETQQKLAAPLPLFEVYNNIGVLMIKKNQFSDAVNYLKPASDAAPRDTDTLFNLGYAYYLAKDYQNAAAILRKEIERRSSDGEAHYILSKSLTALGDTPGAAEASDQAKKLLPQYAQWETKGAPSLARIKTAFSKANYYRYKREQDERINARNTSSTTSTTSTTQTASTGQEVSIESARTAFFSGRDEDALSALGRLLQQEPQNYEAHLLMGRVYERRGDFDRAANALKAAIFWNPKLIPAHILLGRIAVLKNDCVAAQKYLDKALQIEPANQDAQALGRLVEQKCKQ
ncbi:MAG TPA: tetratricopeptide repeat protein [Blastocatellia bacterium]|jgi:Flp pilus assembly protein TadD/TolB-like protein